MRLMMMTALLAVTAVFCAQAEEVKTDVAPAVETEKDVPMAWPAELEAVDFGAIEPAAGPGASMTPRRPLTREDADALLIDLQNVAGQAY